MQHTYRAGPELDELVAAAQGLEAEVYYKTTTSRAVGAVWVRSCSWGAWAVGLEELVWLF